MRRVDTSRLYRFEALYLHTKACPGNDDTPIGVLRRLAKKVWEEYGRTHECPPIIAGLGCDGDQYSYYEVPPVHKIVLKRTQRTPTVLMHELTHALGCGYHNKRFCRLYFELLVKYLKFDAELLNNQALLFSIKV